MTGVLLNALAQVLLKAGTMHVGYFEFKWSAVFPLGLKMATTPAIITAFACYGVSALVWTAVLSRVAVSVAYPMVSIGYVIVAMAGWYIFDETLSTLRVAGICVIVLGVYMVSQPT